MTPVDTGPARSLSRSMDLLHIGKTGGTALRTVLRPIAAEHGLRLRGHDFGLADVPRGQRVGFCVREPLARFVSGFNSRLRRGRPRDFVEWSDDERIAFARFPTADALASALSDLDAVRRADAAAAMAAIRHVARRLTGWLMSPDYLWSRRGDILWIGHQPDLDADFQRLKRALALPADLELPIDPVAAHRTPDGFKTALSEAAQANLRVWYSDDFALFDSTKVLRREMLR